ncbi:MAG TPA: POTRA domain-containing protein [Stellaceae bacterium]|nr:POTRA domain-containing protein [Stellaceae bacterium]
MPNGSRADPGRIEQRFTPQIPAEAPEIPKISPIPAKPSVSLGKAVSFVLAAVDIEGATVYQPGELAPIYEPYLAREIDRAGIQRIIEAITAKYRADGYFLSRAEAPPQDLKLGVLHVNIVEGYIGDVTFEGISADQQAPLLGFARHITEEHPARLATIERYLLLMQDTPGTLATPRLKAPNDGSGAYGLVVHIDHKSADTSFHLDNRGTSLVGPLQSWASVALNGVLQEGARTRATVATTPTDPRELKYVELSHDMAIRTEGTRLILDASLAEVRSAGSTAETDIKTDSRFLKATVLHPIIRSRRQTLTAQVEFDDESSQQFTPQPSAYHDELRVLRVGAIEQIADGWNGLNLFNVEISQGIDGLGASGPGQSNVSRTGGRDDFTKVNVVAARRQVLWGDWATLLTVAAQRSNSPLFLAEQFGLGGDRFGRAFDPSEITGDDGEAVSAELQDTRDTGYAIMPWVQGFLYVDGGETSFHSIGSPGRQDVASTGGGVRLHIYRHYSGEFLVAFPLTQNITNGNPHKGNSFYFGLNANF